MPALPAATELPHVLVSAISSEVATLITGIAVLPALPTVMVCAAAVEPFSSPLKVSDEGDNVSWLSTPVPLSAIVCGESAALSFTVNVPEAVPQGGGSCGS